MQCKQMPLINIDAKQLEWVAAAYLSKDKVAYNEIRTGTDTHSNNQKRLGLPTRLVAKTFLFRLIYGGSSYAYAHDTEFTHISSSDKYWQRLIDEFYSKYSGLYRWHGSLMQEVVRTGKIAMVTGREYEFSKVRGEWPRTTILNYPVQGFGADLMAIARVSLYNRLKPKGLKSKLICTVHDSIVIDSPTSEVDEICDTVEGVWKDIPLNFHRLFGVQFDLPLNVEIQVGSNWGNLQERIK
jgi:DNA polymerase-1